MGSRGRRGVGPGIGVGLGLGLGFAADALLADPQRGHPVAAFGRAATALERVMWRDERRAGVLFTITCVASAALAGSLLQRPAGRTLSTAIATWAVLGATSLVREGSAMGRLLDAGDLAGARARLGHLCARDPRDLDAEELARATVESLAENTSDAVVAPLFWGAVAGVPGLLAYRAVNTLDAMVGYHNARFEKFGWAAARLDDAVNLVPARLTAGLTAALAPAVGGSAGTAWRLVRRDGHRHPSPNAGYVEAAFAGALGIRLGGVNRYGDSVEIRAELGDGRAPAVPDIARAARLSRLVGAAAAVLAGVAAVLARRVTSCAR